MHHASLTCNSTRLQHTSQSTYHYILTQLLNSKTHIIYKHNECVVDFPFTSIFNPLQTKLVKSAAEKSHVYIQSVNLICTSMWYDLGFVFYEFNCHPLPEAPVLYEVMVVGCVCGVCVCVCGGVWWGLPNNNNNNNKRTPSCKNLEINSEHTF